MNDFEKWSELKQKIQASGNSKFVHEGEIWWCNLGINIGQEQNGRNNNFDRPVLIIKKFSNKTCLIAPLTKSEYIHRFRLILGAVGNKKSTLIVSQIRTIDTKRLFRKINKLDSDNFNFVRKNIRRLF